MRKFTFKMQLGIFGNSKGGIPIINTSIRVGDINVRIFACGSTCPKTGSQSRNGFTFFFMKSFLVSYLKSERNILAARRYEKS